MRHGERRAGAGLAGRSVMTRTTKLLFLIALATGCGGNDVACGKRGDGEEGAWEEALKHGKKPDDAQPAQWNQAKTEYRACRDKAGSAGAAPATTGAATSRAIEIQTRVADQMCACAD